jgi:hypothetical protein
MIDLLIREIMNPENGLCDSENFMEEFTKHLKSEETIFGLALKDFEPEKIVKI